MTVKMHQYNMCDLCGIVVTGAVPVVWSQFVCTFTDGGGVIIMGRFARDFCADCTPEAQKRLDKFLEEMSLSERI